MEVDNEKDELDTLIPASKGGDDDEFIADLNQQYIKNIETAFKDSTKKPIFKNGLQQQMVTASDPTAVLLES